MAMKKPITSTKLHVPMSSQNLLLRQFDRLPFQVFSKDERGHYQYVNHFIENTFACAADDFVGMKNIDTPFEFVNASCSHSDDMALAHGFYECMEPIVSDGKIKPGLLQKTVMLDQHQHVVGVLGFLQSANALSGAALVGRQFSEVLLQPTHAHQYFHGVSVRESEVLYMMLRGHSSSAIAGMLGLSTRTVESYIDSMKCKFAVQSRMELISSAVEAGYVFFAPQRFYQHNEL